MYTSLPQASEEFEQRSWAEIEPWYQELSSTALSAETLSPWLLQWSHLGALVDETITRHEIACTQNTADQERLLQKQRFQDEVYIHIQTYDQQLKQQLLESGLEPENFAIPLRNLRAEASIYSEANVALLNDERNVGIVYQNIIGEQTVQWEGEEKSLGSLYPVLRDPERARREEVWRTMSARKLADREELGKLWAQGIQVRQQIAQNAGYDSYRGYRWQQLHRFDYTPDDCKHFHEAVEQVFVPAASKIWEQHRQRLGVETLRPWDLAVNSRSSQAPRTVSDVQGFLQQCQGLFEHIDPQLGAYFQTMLQEDLFDLDDRPSKAPGGYNLALEIRQVPFIFGRVTLLSDGIGLISHEAGHAFHTFEMRPLSYLQQRKESFLPMEFAEVASTSMEFIGSMHLHEVGLCTPEEAAQLRIEHLEGMITQLFLPVARGDAFQHWAYEHPELATDPARCDEKWVELSQRFYPDVDWSGLDAVYRSDWQNILHFYCDPFYFIEYAFAALGAIQVWSNYLHNPQDGLQKYRYALSLGATRTLPELFEAAGAKFAFDREMLQSTLTLLTDALNELEAMQSRV